ncbi:MAG: hypothetical protein JKX85_00045 [Phycisphaeraceae bacterium]|nr:hypothetical protein [Phycisphaeraceae bacterium]
MPQERVLPNLTDEQMSECFSMGNVGFCTECGNEQCGSEPDSEGYECNECGAHAVSGFEQLLVMGMF